MNDFKERFVYARKTRKYTQKSLANAIGVTRGVISNIEYGITNPPRVVVSAICRELNVSESWLMDGVGPMEPEDKRAKILDELYQVCSELTEQQQLYILETIRTMQKYNIVK